MSESIIKNPGTDRFCVFPIQYDNLWDFYKKHISTFWTVEEVLLTDDLSDWQKLNDNERYFIKNVLAFFAASDGIVNENLVLNFYNEVQIPEARQFYAVQMMIEAVHCVAPETKILTDKGYYDIQKLENQNVNIWNGKEWSEVTVRQTSSNSKLLKVLLSNGMELECTEQHKWHIRGGNQNHPENCKTIIKHTNDLCVGDVLIKDWYYPLITYQTNEEFLNPYTHGFFCGDGGYCNGYPVVYLYGDKKKLLSHLNVSSNNEGKETSNGNIICYLTKKINKDKYTTPLNCSIDVKLKWLEGYIDADGTSNLNPKKTCQSLQLSSTNKKFLQDIQLMLSSMGIDSNVRLSHKAKRKLLPTHNEEKYKEYSCKDCFVLYISCYNTVKLYNMGLRPKRVILNTLKQDIKQNKSLIKIIDIKDENRYDKTYCFNEPKNHTGIFNGILTGQSEMYSLLIDTYVSDTNEKNNLFNAVDTIPCVKKKADWAIKWIEEGSTLQTTLPDGFIEIYRQLEAKLKIEDKDTKEALNFLTRERPTFAQRLLAFVCVEGIFFSGSFCAIYWLKNKGLMPGLATANEFISRDEGLHTEFAIELYNMLENRLCDETVHEIFKEAVDIEKEFITESLPVSLLGMNSELMSQYIEFVADRWLVMLGYDKLYNSENPFGFMEMISVNTKENFFETRVSQYQKAGVGQSEVDRTIAFDDDDF